MGVDRNRFLIVVADEFLCPICYDVFWNPVQCSKEHLFCETCIKSCLTRKEQCPMDNGKLQSAQLRPAPRIVKNMMDNLQLNCSFFNRGCDKVIKLADIERHEADCAFKDAPVKKSAINVEGQQFKNLEKELANHGQKIAKLEESANDSKVGQEVNLKLEQFASLLRGQSSKLVTFEKFCRELANESEVVKANDQELRNEMMQLRSSLCELTAQLSLKDDVIARLERDHGKFTEQLRELQLAKLDEVKKLMSEKLHPMILELYPKDAAQITGLLLDMDNDDLLNMISDEGLLKRKAKEARNSLNQSAISKKPGKK